MPPRLSESRELDGRTAAALAVADALTGRQFAAEALREMRAAGRLAGREAGLALEVAQGAIRHLITIEHVLTSVARFPQVPAKLSRAVPPDVRAVLTTAAYQVIWMDRVPPFAAVDQAVEVARRLAQPRAAGMVNAVLRRLSGAIAQRRAAWERLSAAQVRVGWDQACQFDRTVLPVAGERAGGAAHLSAATGERPRRYRYLVARYGPERAEAVAWASQALPAIVLQRHVLRVTQEQFARNLRDAFGQAVEFASDAAFVPLATDAVNAPAFQQGLTYIQDTTAHAAALAVQAEPGERVLDLCAAPGGKSAALALQMRDQGEVVACDTAPERLLRVRDNATRLGLTCVRTRVLPADDPNLPDDAPPFDAALVDVPCANTGVIARRPEARLGLTTRKLRSLATAQAELLRRAARHVRPGGRLVYSTCSLEPEENERIVAAFLDENAEWRRDAEQTTLPAWGPRLADWRDGGYWARLRRG